MSHNEIYETLKSNKNIFHFLRHMKTTCFKGHNFVNPEQMHMEYHRVNHKNQSFWVKVAHLVPKDWGLKKETKVYQRFLIEKKIRFKNQIFFIFYLHFP